MNKLLKQPSVFFLPTLKTIATVISIGSALVKVLDFLLLDEDEPKRSKPKRKKTKKPKPKNKLKKVS